MTPHNKKVVKKLANKEKKTEKARKLDAERGRFKKQVEAIRAKHKSQQKAEIYKARSVHKTKMDAIRKGVKTPANKDATPKRPS